MKLIAMRILAELKVKADGAYKDMNDWLGARFLKEMERFVRTVNQDGGKKKKQKYFLHHVDVYADLDFMLSVFVGR